MPVRSLNLTLLFVLPAGLVLYGAARPLAQSVRRGGTVGKKAASDAPSFKADVAPIVNKFCVGCHGAKEPSAGVSLVAYSDADSALKARDVWERVSRNVADSHMPPMGMPQPTSAQRARMTAALDSMFSSAMSCKLRDPGRVTMRRLNRAEYNNTVRDLFGLDLHPADAFPNDDVGYGFDNIGDVLSLSPLLMEKYLSAAEQVTQAAIVTPEASQNATRDKATFAKLPSFQRRLFASSITPANREAQARRILSDFARRAYRRPATDAEVSRLTRYAVQSMQHGDSFERGIQLAIQAVLVSPNFLFRVESNPGADPKTKTGSLLNDYELASRLSYFLWSSMPDDELFAVATKGTLHNPDVLTAQVRRMLQSPKADALADNFAAQWLQLRRLNNVAPDPARFPDFNDEMRRSMRTETELFFKAIVREDRSVLDFINGKYTYLNEALAKHYGVEGVKGSEFRRVALTDPSRGGILTQASVLTVTSNPTRTSPVKRGKWVMEQLLNTPLPPPPPGVGDLPDDKKQALVGTLRQRMEQHRANPKCASCHARMDPIGFGLENFDAVGVWRDKDGGAAIDPSGVLPDGKKFNGPAELKAILMGKKEQFTRCLSEKLLTFALGRGVETFDRCSVDAIAANAAKHDYKFSSLVTAIVTSDPFRKRRDGGS